jgi:site-specific recombinase XerD
MVRFEITLDKRTQKKNGTFPLKLRVTDYNKVRFVPLKADYTEVQFESIFGKNAKKSYAEYKVAAESVLHRAIEIEKTLKPFNYEVFRDLLFSNQDFKRRSGIYVGDLFDLVIKRKTNEGCFKTATSYKSSKSILLKFRPDLKIDEVTPEFLRQFESWYISRNEGKLTSSISIYLRPLRAIFNELISEGKLPQDVIYPFGRYRYIIPEVRRAKTTLKRDEIIKILTCKNFENEDEEFARNLWVFQFYCNGVNLKDLINIKWSDQIDQSFVIRREKTKNTMRGNPQLVRIPITSKLQSILDQIGDRNSPYVLGFLKKNSSESTILNKKSKVGKFMNSNLIKLGERLGLSVKLTTKVARDAYATTLKKSGVSIEAIAEMLGQTSTAVTKHYLDSFDQEQIHEINNFLP